MKSVKCFDIVSGPVPNLTVVVDKKKRVWVAQFRTVPSASLSQNVQLAEDIIIAYEKYAKSIVNSQKED